MTVPDEVMGLVERAASREALGAGRPAEAFSHRAGMPGSGIYANRHESIGIDFTVERVDMPDSQTLDPRIVRIAPGMTNELHRHAHESLFVVLEGTGRVRVGECEQDVGQGDLAFVPRWALHQTSNTSADRELVLLAITDFGFTRAVLGDYTKKTRTKRRRAE